MNKHLLSDHLRGENQHLVRRVESGTCDGTGSTAAPHGYSSSGAVMPSRPFCCDLTAFAWVPRCLPSLSSQLLNEKKQTKDFRLCAMCELVRSAPPRSLSLSLPQKCSLFTAAQPCSASTTLHHLSSTAGCERQQQRCPWEP